MPCRINKILSQIDRNNGKFSKDNPEFVMNGDACLVEMIPLKPMCCEVYSKYPELGRIIIREHDNRIIACGVIKETTKATCKEDIKDVTFPRKIKVKHPKPEHLKWSSIDFLYTIK